MHLHFEEVFLHLTIRPLIKNPLTIAGQQYAGQFTINILIWYDKYTLNGTNRFNAISTHKLI